MSTPFDPRAYTAIAQVAEGDAPPWWAGFRTPRRRLTASTVDEVVPVLTAVEDACRRGSWAVGYLAYEAAPAFDPRFATHPPTALPLTAWCLFDETEWLDLDAAIDAAPVPTLAWQPRVDATAYRAAIDAIHRHIAAGDTYQVNYTFPLDSPFEGDAVRLFLGLVRAQRPAHATYLDLDRWVVASVTPELFVRRDGDDLLVTRPMKGTARRGRTAAEDRAAVATLAASEKQRAENLMIVDMMRNDLGRIARPGSVAVPSLFRVETYPTVHQLTSTVTARSDAGLVDIGRALFPCASITGAPKVRTMELIRSLEPHPRGIYTGAVAVVAPGGRPRLGVAICTVTVDREQRHATYGTGGGIVWDSEAVHEYDECRTKALVLTAPPPRFDLLETLLWRPGRGYALLDRHLDRLITSARYFGRPCDRATMRDALDAAIATFGATRQRVRLTVDRHGKPTVEAAPITATGRATWRVALATEPIDPHDPFYCHKTTHREGYERAQATHPLTAADDGIDEVILWNPANEVTESCRANVVVRFGHRLTTPPLRCGLLPGTLRAALLARGTIEEAIVPTCALAEADAVYLINSLRGWIRTIVVDPHR